jgi:hypothetical protein
MTECTLVANDILYMSYYLKEENPITGSITPYTLVTATSIILRMRQYNSTINTINVTMSTLATPSNTLGYCRALVTIPTAGTYTAEVEVYEALERITFPCQIIYKVISELG